MKATTTTTTTTSKQTKRQEQTQANNQKRIATTKATIKKTTQNKENIVNVLAVETVQTFKQYGKNSKQFTDKSQQLCCVLTQIRLKRLYNNENTSNEQQRITKAKIAMTYDKNGGTKLDKAIEQLNSLYVETYNQNGDKVIKCIDTKLSQDIEKKIVELLAVENNGGMDLVQDAYLKLWSYLENQTPEIIQDDYLLKPFEIVIPHTQVYLKSKTIKDKSLWQYTTTNIIKEIQKTISRSIESERKPQELTTPYEMNEIEIDGESIRRYHQTKSMYCDTTTDFNGKITTITNNQTTEQFFESMPEKCNLSKMETVILKAHYLDNKSFTEIADKYEVKISTIENHNARLKDKIVKSGIFANYGLTEKTDNGQTAKTIYMFTKNGEYITAFESIGQANKTLNISKGCISENLKGKRQTAGGYVFTYTR